MLAGAALMVKLSVFCTVWGGFELSRSVNVCDVVPCVVGVPVIAPVAALNERLARSAGVTDHVYGGVPPEPLSEVEYAWLTVPFGSEAVVIANPVGPGAGAGAGPVVVFPGVGPLSPQPVDFGDDRSRQAMRAAPWRRAAVDKRRTSAMARQPAVCRALRHARGLGGVRNAPPFLHAVHQQIST